MATVSTIAIKLDAQTASLKKGFNDTQKAVKGLSGQIKQSLGAGVMKLNAALEVTQKALGAVRNAMASVMETINRGAEIGDFADRIQIGTEELQQLHRVTEQWGGQASIMNTSLQRLTRRLADAERNGGPLADRLRELGVNVRQIASLAPDKQFLMMADAISQLDTAGQQASLAMAAMDTEGVSLLETLRLGSDEIHRQMEALGEYGIMSDENVRKSQAAAAAMIQLKNEWRASKDVLILELVPAIQTVLGWLVNFVELLGKMYRVHKRYMADIFGEWEQEVFTSTGPVIPEPVIEDAGKVLGDTVGKAWEYGLKRTVRATRNEVMKIPGVAAVTSMQGGFSALQEAKRREQARAQWEREMKELGELQLQVMTTIADQLLFVPVGL